MIDIIIIISSPTRHTHWLPLRSSTPTTQAHHYLTFTTEDQHLPQQQIIINEGDHPILHLPVGHLIQSTHYWILIQTAIRSPNTVTTMVTWWMKITNPRFLFPLPPPTKIPMRLFLFAHWYSSKMIFYVYNMHISHILTRPTCFYAMPPIKSHQNRSHPTCIVSSIVYLSVIVNYKRSGNWCLYVFVCMCMCVCVRVRVLCWSVGGN